MILKKVTNSTELDDQVTVADCLDCSECIHEKVCKWRDKCLNDKRLISVPDNYPFIHVSFSCTEFQRDWANHVPACKEDLSNLSISYVGKAEDETAEDTAEDKPEEV